jgi:hypothetical protein
MRRAWLWILVSAALAVSPILILGNAWGHDFDFHVPVWMSVARQFQEGILYPRWADQANAGFGDPFMIFYPPLSWMTGGLLGSILPWKWVPCAYTFLVFVLAGTAMWKLARDWLEPPDAMMASLLYAWSPYLIVMAYKRCSYGELLASAFFPLLIWAAIRIACDGRKMIPPLVIVFAAIWLSDLPAGMIASYSLALLLVLGSVLHRSLQPLRYGSIAIVATFASLAFFLLPAAWERQWVEIGQVFRPDWTPETNFLFMQNGSPVLSLMNKWISLLALLLMMTTAAAALFSRRSAIKESAFHKTWYLMVALGGVSAFLMFRQSWLVWQILPALRYVEYPWRWLTPLSLAGVLLVAAAVAPARKKRLLWIVAALAIGGMSVTLLYKVRWDFHDRHINVLVAAARSDVGYRTDEDKDWTLPRGSHPSQLSESASLVAAAGESREVQIDIEQWTAERKIFSVHSPRPTLLKIKLLNYPAWHAKVNGTIYPLETDPETGQMLLPVSAGLTHADVTFGRTWDRTAGMIVSLASIATMALLGLRGFWRGSSL